MRTFWMALLTVVMMTGCGAGDEQPPRLAAALVEDPGLSGRAWNSPLRSVLAAGSAHSLALDAEGNVWAWGHNASGQLGDGTTRSRTLPVKVVGLEQVKSVVTGQLHTVALRADGTVWAWGENGDGQLGQPASPMPMLTPSQVPGLSGVVALAAGIHHTLALRADGTVWAWGGNIYGQLGQPANGNANPIPSQVPGLSGVVTLSAHGRYTLALRADGTVWAWGANFNGELGQPSNYSANPIPAQVPGFSGVKALSAGDNHVLALREDGTVWAWGANYSGQTGQPLSYMPDHTPVQVTDLTGVVSIAAGFEFSLALRRNGTVWSWGNNSNGQLGDGTTVSRHTPQQVQGVKHGISLAADGHPLVMSRNGTVWGWGDNSNGQLGTGTELRPTPVRVPGFSDAMKAAAGTSHVLTLRADGTVWSWGSNASGQLGDGTSTRRASPVQVPGLSEVEAVSAGSSHSLALRADGTVWGWGANASGQLGRPANYTANPTPVQVPGLSGAVAVGAAGNHSLALLEDGTVWAWGANMSGQLGQPANYTANPTPAQVPGLTNVVALASGDSYVLALRTDGTVWAWGSNSAGQLGRPANYTANPTPAQVQGLSGIVGLSAAYQHALALRADGTVWAWGANWYGQLGDGTQQSRYTPAPVPSLTGVTGVTAAERSSLVVLQDGSVWGFGGNDYRQVTSSEQLVQLVPIQRPELAGVTALTSGRGTTLALREDGTVWAWGSNAYDQIGDGVSSLHVTPARVRLPCRFTGRSSHDHRTPEARHCPTTP